MDSPQDRAFRAILNFVNDLWSAFSSREVTPLALYHRLLQHVKFTDKDAINRFLGGFFMFVSTHDPEIVGGGMTLAPTASIAYSERAFIDIGRLYHRADSETKKAIRNHLLNISAIMMPTEDKNAKLKEAVASTGASTTPSSVAEMSSAAGVDDSSAESKLVKGILAKVEDATKSVDASNPTAAITSLFSSGVMTDLFGSMQASVESGDVNPQKLLGTIQQVMGSFMGGIGGDSASGAGGGMGNMFSGIMGMMAGTGKATGHGTAAALMAEGPPVSADEIKAALSARKDGTEEVVPTSSGKKKKNKKNKG
jgi:hypothetical protein